MTPGGPACGLEFAHVHARYIPSDHPTAIQTKARGLKWQTYQGGGQGSMHLCLTLRDAAAVLDAGWHLSSFGGVDAVARKLEAYIEAPIYNTSFYTATSSSSSASTAATGPSGPESTGASTAATTTASAARRPTPRGRTTRRCAPRATRSSGRARTSSRSRRSPRTTP